LVGVVDGLGDGLRVVGAADPVDGLQRGMGLAGGLGLQGGDEAAQQVVDAVAPGAGRVGPDEGEADEGGEVGAAGVEVQAFAQGEEQRAVEAAGGGEQGDGRLDLTAAVFEQSLDQLPAQVAAGAVGAGREVRGGEPLAPRAGL
jgi:hypothetical protein